MTHTILNTVITFIVSSSLGYCVNIIKNYKKQKNDIMDEFRKIKESQLMDMRSDLSNKFYIYDSMETVDDYLYESFIEKCQHYFELNGNHYIKNLYERALKWKIKYTGIMLEKQKDYKK